MKNWERYRDYLETGDFHVHTDYTEGTNTVFELCEQAILNNLKLICFSEHVRRSLSYDFDALLRDIDTARQRYPRLKILSGCEAKVMDLDGSLDVSEEILSKVEIVIASFHSFPYADKADFLKALYGALRNPSVDIWGHPLTFLRNISPTAPELHGIIRECIKRRVLIEDSLVQAYQNPPSFLEACKELGATIVVNSDAHDIYSLKRL